MLQVENLTKKFGRKVLAVDNLSVTLDAGELCVVLGPNGAGKSTTIKSIAGLLRYRGVIKIDGYMNHTMEAKRLLAYVPETPAIYDLLTVDEHIRFVSKVYKLEDDEPYVESLLKRFDMDDKRKKLGADLSKGMKQKLSIILGVMIKPRVILFDEPMIGLDPKAIKSLKALFDELVDMGTIVLLSTHIIDSIVEDFDRVIIMNEGHIVANFSREEVEKQEIELEDLFFRLTSKEEAIKDLDQSGLEA